MSDLAKGLRYLLGSPDYFFYYFAGRLTSVLEAATGGTAGRLAELRAELLASDFSSLIRRRTGEIAGEGWELGKDHHFLYSLVRLTRPRVIVETGVFDGFFSACFLKALADNQERHGIDGELFSIDLPAREEIHDSTSRHRGRTSLPRGQEPGWVIPDGLRDRWRCDLGDSRELLPRRLADASHVDLFFHDSLHTHEHMTFEYEAAWPKLEAGAILLSHDVHWNRAFPQFARRHGQRPYAAHGFGLIRKSSPR